LYYNVANFKQIAVVQPFTFPAGAACYIVSRKVAELIVREPATIAYDNIYRCFLQNDINYYVLSKTIAKIASFSSSIDSASEVSRISNKAVTIQKIGILNYKANRVKVRARYQFALYCYNVKKFGIFRTICVAIGTRH
jgi:hypothetical protein